MALVISLRDFVNELSMVSSNCHAYINRVTGELITITDDEITMFERDDDPGERLDWEQEAFDEAKRVLSSDDFIQLPRQYDIHEYAIMENFCLSISNEKISDVLLDKIRGSGAFRRFKDTIYRYDLEQDWFQFREEAFKEIAETWLKDNGFEYSDDMNIESTSS